MRTAAAYIIQDQFLASSQDKKNMIWVSQVGCLGRGREGFKQISHKPKTIHSYSSPCTNNNCVYYLKWQWRARWAVKAASSLSVPSAPDVTIIKLIWNLTPQSDIISEGTMHPTVLGSCVYETHWGFWIRCNWRPKPTAPSVWSYVNSWTGHVTRPFASPLLPLEMCNTHLKIN